MNTSFRLGLLIGVLFILWRDATAARTHRGSRLPMPTRETIPIVAEAMGAATYEESVEEESVDSVGSSSKRVQRKLTTEPREDVDADQEYMEYQGVMGRPGVDFPVLPSIPRTSFSCRKVKSSGYYADLDTGCQVFHICDGGRKISFLCPNGTIFRQSHLICDWWFRVDCGRSVELYEESAEQLAHDQMIYKKRAEALAKAMENGSKRNEDRTKSEGRERYNEERTKNEGKERYNEERQPRFRQENRYRDDDYRGRDRNEPSRTTPQQDDTYDRNTVSTQQRRRQRPTQKTTTTTETPNYPQFNPKNRIQEQERQIPAETASFASNGRHRFANQLNQQNYFRTTGQPQTTTTETTTQYRYPEIKSSSRPVSSTTHLPTTVQSMIRTTEGNSYTTTTTKPIFTVHVKPSKDFSYVELHRHQNEQVLQQTPLPPQKVTPYSQTPQPITGSVTTQPPYATHNIVSSTPFPKTVTPFSNAATPYSKTVTPFANSVTPYSKTVTPFSNSVTPFSKTVTPFSNTVTPFPKTVSPFVNPTSPQPSTTYIPHVQTQKPVGTFFPILNVTSPPPFVLPQTSTTSTTTSTSTSPPLAKENIEPINPLAINSLVEHINKIAESRHQRRLSPSGANTLLSLASYYGSAIQDVNLGIGSRPVATTTHKNPSVSEILLRSHSGSPDPSPELDEIVTTTATDVKADAEDLPSVLTKATKDSYSYLFADSKEQTLNVNETNNKDINKLGEGKDELLPQDIEIEIDSEESGRIVQPTTENKLVREDSYSNLKLKHSNDLRELAQVFSRALSAYLEDPESFKEILAQVRPTEPSLNENTTPSVDDEVLDFSDANGEPTDPPLASVSKADIGNVNVEDINNLATSIRNLEEDNSLEQVTNSPESETITQKSYVTSTYPTSIAIDINNIIYNQSQIDTGSYFPETVSAEDSSYFPTAGGVHDTSRPRYGGFQNNTYRSSPVNYSPYGSGLARNITGSPITATPPATKPDANVISTTQENPTTRGTNTGSSKIPDRLDIPEAQDVNNLFIPNTNQNIPTFSPLTAETEETQTQSPTTQPSLLQREQDYFGPSGDQEKVLIASGSQSLVSGNNYVYRKEFRKGKQESSFDKDDAKSLYSGSSFASYAPTAISQNSGLLGNKEENNKFSSGVQEGRGIYSKSLKFDSSIRDVSNEQDENFTTEAVETTTVEDIFRREKITTNGPVWTENPLQNDSVYNKFGLTFSDYETEEQNITFQNIDLGNGVTLERTLKYTTPPITFTTWTSQPIFETTTLIPETTTIKEEEIQQTTVKSSDFTPGHVKPTTYHPPHISETNIKISSEPESTTTLQPVTGGHFITTNYDGSITTNQYEAYASQTTVTPEVTTLPGETEHSFEMKAKEMFGSLNETAAGTLMEMMNKAESNMTIRRLVLLLVADKSRENRTAAETRASLIHALLNSEDSPGNTATSTQATSTTTNAPTHKPMVKRVRVSRVRSNSTHKSVATNYRRGKSYRGTDSLTAVRGSNVQSSTELTNRINSARLFIPPSPKEKLPYDSDARAVELLKSLYNLAAKWG